MRSAEWVVTFGVILSVFYLLQNNTMKRFKVLLPRILLEDWAPHFGVVKAVTDDGVDMVVIDEVSYNGDADDCRVRLIDHDWYSEYIVCVEMEGNPFNRIMWV